MQLAENVSDVKRQFSDINLKLNALNSQLPQGAGPISFQSDFGDTAALMLTIASPKADPVEIDIRARAIQSAIQTSRAREETKSKARQLPSSTRFLNLYPRTRQSGRCATLRAAGRTGGNHAGTPANPGPRIYRCRWCLDPDDTSIHIFIQTFFQKQLQRSELHPDAWEPIIVRDPQETRERLATVAGDKYSYAELDDFSDLIARTVQGAPETSKVERRGVLPQVVYLEYSQDRLAAYGSNQRHWEAC